MTTIDISTPDRQLTAHIRPTNEPTTWELVWSGAMPQQHIRRLLQDAETAVLRNGGERLTFTCGADRDVIHAELDRWTASIITREEDRCTIQLIESDDDGFIHDDFDFRTPLQRITCPTCVKRIIGSRIERRQDALETRPGPKAIAQHTRLIAEAYTRLAEIEENLIMPPRTS